MRCNYLIAGCSFLIFVGCINGDAVPPGFVEGHLKIISSKEVELAGKSPPKFVTESYAEYPLIVLDQSGRKLIARITADANGYYHVSLPPGDYVLDVDERARKHARGKPRAFKVTLNQTVNVDMDIDTGVR